jgi:outer membrane beta-barrel protein
MKTTRNILLSAALLGGLLGADLITPSQASAQEVQITGPLAGQPAVRRMRLYREMRILLEPNFTFTLQDEYSRTLFAGLHAGFYFTDWLGIGVWGAYGFVSLDTNLSDEITGKGVPNNTSRLSFPSRDGFTDQVGRMNWAAAAQLEFIPLRGKLAIFEKLFVDTDFYIFAGVGVVGIEERDGAAAAPCLSQPEPGRTDCLIGSQGARASRVAIAPTFGAGLNLYFNGIVGLNLSWRGLPFSWNTSGFDNSGDPRGDFPDGEIDEDDRFFRLNHMFTVGITIYLPTEPTITD